MSGTWMLSGDLVRGRSTMGLMGLLMAYMGDTKWTY